MWAALLLVTVVGQVNPDAGLGAPDSGAAAPTEAADAGAGPLLPYALDVRTLKNGLQVVLVNTGPGGLAAYFTLVRVGSRNEVEEGRTGFAHFFEHMMFRGTDAYPAEKFAETLQAVGVNSNASTDDDFTLFTDYGPSDALPTVITLEADRFQHLKYTKEGFRTEAKAVLGEYLKDVADPDFALDEALHKAAFRKSTYRHTAMGFLADIQRMPDGYGYSLAFFKRWYVPANVTLYVVGDLQPDAVFAEIDKAYGGWGGQLSVVKIPKEPEQRQPAAVTLHWTSATLPRVTVGYHAPSLGTDLQAAAIQNVLGPYLFGPASALYRSLVIDQHLAASLNATYGDHREPALFSFEAEARDEQGLAPIQAAVDEALARLQQQGPDPKLLEDVKSNQRYGVLMGFETPGAIAAALAMTSAPTGDPASLERLAQAIAQVTPAQVQAFAQKYLTAKNRTTVILQAQPSDKGGQP